MAAAAFVLGWITVVVIYGTSPTTRTESLNRLSVLVNIVKIAGAGALVGVWFSVARPFRRLASIAAAACGAFAIGVVFGLLMAFNP